MQTSAGSGWAQRKIILVDANMNYAKLVREILDIAIHQSGVNMALDEDIYQINNMQAAKFPVFVCAPTEPQIERENYYEFHLTLYYIDREQLANNEYNNPETSLIHSAGISILGNVIKKIRAIDEVISVDENISYTLFNDTEVFADRCNGVYTTITVIVPKESTCVTY